MTAGRGNLYINPALALVSAREDRKMYRQPAATGVRFPHAIFENAGTVTPWTPLACSI
jgi:hypothetical protein